MTVYRETTLYERITFPKSSGDSLTKTCPDVENNHIGSLQIFKLLPNQNNLNKLISY